MLRFAIEYVPPNSNVISNPLQAGRSSRSIFRLWDALAGAKSLASRNLKIVSGIEVSLEIFF